MTPVTARSARETYPLVVMTATRRDRTDVPAPRVTDHLSELDEDLLRLILRETIGDASFEDTCSFALASKASRKSVVRMMTEPGVIETLIIKMDVLPSSWAETDEDDYNSIDALKYDALVSGKSARNLIAPLKALGLDFSALRCIVELQRGDFGHVVGTHSRFHTLQAVGVRVARLVVIDTF